MRAPLWQRFKFWVCDVFGHAKEDGRLAPWHYNDFRHRECGRCGRIVSTKELTK